MVDKKAETFRGFKMLRVSNDISRYRRRGHDCFEQEICVVARKPRDAARYLPHWCFILNFGMIPL